MEIIKITKNEITKEFEAFDVSLEIAADTIKELDSVLEFGRSITFSFYCKEFNLEMFVEDTKYGKQVVFNKAKLEILGETFEMENYSIDIEDYFPKGRIYIYITEKYNKPILRQMI